MVNPDNNQMKKRTVTRISLTWLMAFSRSEISLSMRSLRALSSALLSEFSLSMRELMAAMSALRASFSEWAKLFCDVMMKKHSKFQIQHELRANQSSSFLIIMMAGRMHSTKRGHLTNL